MGQKVFVQPTYLNFSDGSQESDEGGLYEPFNKNNDVG